MFEYTDKALELLVLELLDQPLTVLISISITILLEGSWELECMLRSKYNNIFAKVFLITIIWDSSKKERSDKITNSVTMFQAINKLLQD